MLLLLMLTLVPGRPPTTLPGRWQLRQVAFEARRVLTAPEQEQLNDSVTAVLNQELRRGQATSTLTLLPTGGYRYASARLGSPPTAENGLFRLVRDTLYVQPTAASALPPRQRVVRLTRRVLVLETPGGQPGSLVYRQERYRRVAVLTTY